jgi:hypothetical protein
LQSSIPKNGFMEEEDTKLESLVSQWDTKHSQIAAMKIEQIPMPQSSNSMFG